MNSTFSSSRRQFCRHLTAASMAYALPLRVWAKTPSPETILEEVHSPFNHIRIHQQGTVRTMYFVADTGTQYIESRIDLRRPVSLDLDYSRTMMAGLLVQPQIKRMLMIGVGGGQLSNYFYHRFPDVEIDAVDIDPEVIRLAKAYFLVPNGDPRYRTYADDGRVFIERAKQSWDMIILDAFRGIFVPYHLKTYEFYQACLAHLSPRGVVVANLHNHTKMYANDRETLAQVFPNSYSFVSESGNQTTFVASAAKQRVGVYAMRKAAQTLQAQFDFDLLGLAARYYLRSDWEVGAKVLKDDFRPSELERAAERHNQTCIYNCRYGL